MLESRHSCNVDTAPLRGKVQGLAKGDYLGIRRPTVLRVIPYNQEVITYYFVGFGDAGMDSQAHAIATQQPSAGIFGYGLTDKEHLPPGEECIMLS